MDIASGADIALRMVREAKFLSYDTETSGLDWRINSPVGYVVGAASALPAAPEGVGTPMGAWGGMYMAHSDVVYVPVRHGGGGNLLGGQPLKTPEDPIKVHEFEVALARAFDERNRTLPFGRVVGHHIKFDAHFSANAGILLGPRLTDTQDRAAILDEYRKSFSLDACAKDYGVTAKLGEGLYAHLASLFGGAANKNQMANFWRTSGTDPMVQEYATGDGITTMELYFEQQKKIIEEELTAVDELEADLIWTLFRMERKGIRVDENRIDALQRETERAIERDINSIRVGFNVRSPNMVKEYFESHGITDWPTTEKGNPSFTESWMKKTAQGRKIIEIRQNSNLINSFIKPLRETHIYKGRVHATLNQLKSDDSGTISGRFSCTSPNLQQVPKRNKDLAIPFRSIFIPDDGKIFWERDWSQCEPRLFAHYSGDENLLNGYNSKPFVDAHSVVAKLLDVERDPTAKRMNMGIFTGMQPKSFAGHMDWPLEKATHAHSLWFQNFPRVREFQEKAKYRLQRRGYVMTLLGRRCRLEHSRFAYRGTSKIIQGSNADIAKYKLLEMDRACQENGDIVEVLMTVHDSFNGQREDTEQARKLMDDLVHIMEDVQGDPFNLRVPFVAEGYEGPNWAVASFGEKANAI